MHAQVTFVFQSMVLWFVGWELWAQRDEALVPARPYEMYARFVAAVMLHFSMLEEADHGQRM